MSRKSWRKGKISTTWDPVAAWYYGWVGATGSKHHRRLAIPALLELLDLGRASRSSTSARGMVS